MVGSRVRSAQSWMAPGMWEEITEWVVGQRIVMRMHDCTPPLEPTGHAHFVETWTFEEQGPDTLVTPVISTRSAEGGVDESAAVGNLHCCFRRAIGRAVGRDGSVYEETDCAGMRATPMNQTALLLDRCAAGI